MKSKILLVFSIFFWLSIIAPAHGLAEKGSRFEINTGLMNATFKIEGNKGAVGTCFVIGKRLVGQSKGVRMILVTAAHVLENIKEESATLYLREKIGENDFRKKPYQLPIRKDGKPLWVKHPSGDVAAMYLNIPKEFSYIVVVSTDYLVIDAALKEWEIHPGDELFSLGFPFGLEANETGFPILRSGKLSSYPILPTKKTKTFLFDFEIFPGNSGGPVYFFQTNRFIKGEIHQGRVIRFIMGLVSKEWKISEEVKLLREFVRKDYPMSLAIGINASIIQETIDLLPWPPSAEN